MLKNVFTPVYFLLLCAITSISSAQQNPSVQITRAKTPPVLADYIKGTPIDAGTEITDFKQRIPSDGSAASKPTSAYLSYDDTHFYAIFVAQDDPALIRARLAKREAFEGMILSHSI